MTILQIVEMIKKEIAICNSRYDLMGYFDQCNGCKYDNERDENGECPLLKSHKLMENGEINKAKEVLEHGKTNKWKT